MSLTPEPASDPARDPASGSASDPAAQPSSGASASFRGIGRPDPLLRVRGLAKSFRDQQVLRSIDLDVARGKVLVLIGPSGSGKTTILRSLDGLETPDAGTIEITGGDAPLSIDFGEKRKRRYAERQRDELRDRSAMVFQHYNLFPHKTVLQNVTEAPLRVQKRPRAEVEAEALKLLERVGLSEKRDSYPFELSGGQQQRVGIVRALALKPQILLFDEPTSALDPEIVGDVLGIMAELAAEGWTMVVVTHEIAFAREVADEVLFLDGGVIVESGPPEQIFTAPRQARTRTFLERLLRPLS